MKLLTAFLSLALLLTTSVSSSAKEKKKEVSSPLSKAVRIQVKMKDVYQWHTPSTRIRFFVQTDSVEVPIICMADNAHFPSVTRYSVRERHVEDKSGVVVDIYFSKPVSLESHKKAALAINLWQPNLSAKEYPVLPTNGKKLYVAAQRIEGESKSIASDQ